MGAFRSTKICGLKFRKFHVPNGTVLSGYADPTQATSRLVIVLVSRIQKSGIGDNNFVKWKGKFRSNRPKWPDRSKRTTFKAGSEYSGRTKPKLSLPFDVPYEISGILGWMESALYHLDDVWAGCNAGFLLDGDTNFRFICNCFFSVALRYLLFRLECFRWYCVYLFWNVRSI